MHVKRSWKIHAGARRLQPWSTLLTASLPTVKPFATPRLDLRALGIDDAEGFRAMTDEPAITGKIHFLASPFTIEQARRLIFADGDGRDCFFGVWRRDDPGLIGTVGAHLRGTDAIEIGYWFASAMQGRGFATEAVGAIVTELATAAPSRLLFAECRPENASSWRLLDRLGFRPDGRDGRRSGRKRLVLNHASS